MSQETRATGMSERVEGLIEMKVERVTRDM
jgi:hypothetical protein